MYVRKSMNHGSCIFLLLVCTNHFKCNRIKLSLSVYWEWFKNTNIMLLVDTVTVVSNMSLYYVCSLFQRGVVFYTFMLSHCVICCHGDHISQTRLFIVMGTIYFRLCHSLLWRLSSCQLCLAFLWLVFLQGPSGKKQIGKL